MRMLLSKKFPPDSIKTSAESHLIKCLEQKQQNMINNSNKRTTEAH